MKQATEKNILLTAAAFGTATMLMVLLGQSGHDVGQIDEAKLNIVQARSRRSEELDSFFEGDDDEFDGSCADFNFEGGCGEELDDVAFFADSESTESTSTVTPNPQARAKRKQGGNRKNKEKIDTNAYQASEKGQEMIEALNAKLDKQITNIHNKVGYSFHAALNPDALEHPIDASYGGATSTMVWANAASSGDNDCSFESENRVSGNTQAVYMLYPSDMMYSTNIDQAALLGQYKDFFNGLYAHVRSGNDNTKVHVGSYSTGVVKHKEIKSQYTVDDAFNFLSPEGQLTVPMRGTNIRVTQPRLSAIMNKLSALSKKWTKNRMSGSAGRTCFTVMIIHTLPSDYKDIVSTLYDNEFGRHCVVIPVSIVPKAQNAYFESLSANIAPDSQNKEYTFLEEALRGHYSVNSAADRTKFFSMLANRMASFMCTVENRLQCLVSRSAWFEAVVELDRSITTTEATTTTDFTTTTAWSTLADEDYGELTAGADESDEDEAPAEMQCCGPSAGAEFFNANKKFCCEESDGYFVSSDAC